MVRFLLITCCCILANMSVGSMAQRNSFMNMMLPSGIGKTPASLSRGNVGVPGLSTGISRAALAMQIMQNPFVKEVFSVITEEIQKSKGAATAKNLTTSDDLGTLFGLVNPLKIIQRILSSHSASSILPNDPKQAIDAQCHRDVIDTLDGIAAPKRWAIDMLDAFGKPTPGIGKGSLYFIGSYDECYEIKPHIKKGDVMGNRTHTESRTFGTRYCRADISVLKSKEASHVDTRGVSVKLTWGMCVPDTCHKDDIMGIFKLGLMKKLKLPVKSVYCYEDTDLSSDLPAIAAISVLSCFGLLIVLGTVYDMYKANSSYTTQTDIVNTDILKKCSSENGESNNLYTVGSPRIVMDIKEGGDSLTPSYMPHREVTTTEVVIVTTKDTDNIPTAKESTEHIVNTDDNQMEHETREPILARIILCFSMYTNVPKLLHAKLTSGSVSCIPGIRFFSLSWIMLPHTLSYGIVSKGYETLNAGNMLDLLNNMHRFTFQVVLTSVFAVDTFFVLSAFLVTWLNLKEIDRRKKKFSVQYGLMFYLHRFWRMTPIYAMVIMTFTCLYQYLGSGPMWPSTNLKAENCKTTWWTNLLYINNLVKVDTACMGWTWYLADDMQFYVISPIFIIAMYMSTKAGAILTSLLMFTGMAATLGKEIEYDGSFLQTNAEEDYFHNIYVVPWCRVSSWTVGMLFGLFVYKRGFKPIQSRILVWIGWLVATAVGLFLVYISHTALQEGGTEWTNVEKAVYDSFGRPMWALCVAWVIFACNTGCGGLVNSILSWKGFIPLSRLTYAAYLVHPICMMVYIYSRRTLLYINDYDTVYLYLGHLCVTFMVAFVCSLSFEAPFMSLEKIVFGRGRR